MKRTLSAVAMMCTCLGLSAQQVVQPSSQVRNLAAEKDHYSYTGDELHTFVPIKQEKSGVSTALDIIGNSFYDLQSNACVDDRIHYDPTSGEVMGVWTMSLAPGPAFNDRGTGYNYYDGSQWQSPPTARLENLRTGWPSLVVTDTSEVIVSHSADDLVAVVRAGRGSGAWSNMTLSSLTDGVLWPRAVVGGSNGKTVHVVAISTPTGNSGNIYKGLDGALLYYRSLDGGFTWDIQDSLLPGQDTTRHYGFSGDTYAIDARGDNIAIAVFNDYEDSFILKSSDNGDNWTKTVFRQSPLADYNAQAAGAISDTNNDGIADTIPTTDNIGSIIIDNNNKVHLAYGFMRVLDTDPVLDAASSYFPFTNQLRYWNEITGNVQVIGFAQDLDNDGTFPFTQVDDIGNYEASMASQPKLAVDANNNLFCTYAAVNELKSSGFQFYRDIFMVSSRDGGATWGSQKMLTPNRPVAECVFPSLAKHVDDYLRIVYQEDNEPGLTVRGDEDPDGSNNIMYLEIDTAVTEFVGMEETSITKSNFASIYPNPATTEAIMTYSIDAPGYYQIEVSNITGVNVKTIDLGNVGSGSFKQSIDVKDLHSGVYIVTLRTEGYATSKRLIVH